MATQEQAEATRQNLSKIVRMPEVQKLVGLKTTAINDRINAGTFPPKINLGGRAVGFLESDIFDWINERVAESQGDC